MITVVCSSKNDLTEFEKHVNQTCGLHNKVQFIGIHNEGTLSLPEAYNYGLKTATNDIVVFMHDDITIETKQWGNKLLKLFNDNPEYSILGVAGSKYMPESGRWWENPKKMYGRVQHTHEGKTWLSSYSDDLGKEIEETVIVDGVFFAVDKTKIAFGFDESYAGFHFYDVSFCFRNFLSGKKVGVTTIVRVNHRSIGMVNEAWEANRVQFAEQYADTLPVNLKKVLRKGEKLKVLLGVLSIGGDTPEETYALNLIKELVEQKCEVWVAANYVNNVEKTLKNLGVYIYTLHEPPNFRLGDGKWMVQNGSESIVTEPKTLYKLGNKQFDVLHINHKTIAEHLLRLYPDVDAISTIHTTTKATDEPIRVPQMKKFIAVDEDVREVLVDGYKISPDLVETKVENITELYKSILS